MKKIIALLSMILLGLIGFAQNEMLYQSTVWNNGNTIVEKKIDITFLKENSLVNYRLADSIVSFINNYMIRDVNVDYRVLIREFGINANWGVTRTTALSLGDYSGYYTSYQDTIMTNFFDLIFSDNRIAKMELSARIRNELVANKATLLNEICVGYTINGNGKVIGKLISYNLTDGYAMLLERRGIYCWYVDYYTFCKATNEELEAYESGNSYLNY